MHNLLENGTLADRDLYLMKIENEIENKRKLLLKKQKKINELSKNNHFLEHVRDDYNKYYLYIVQQKQDQMKALHLLNKYVEDLTVSGNLSKHNLTDAKYEQKKIIHEMSSIKKNLDEIIKNNSFILNSTIEKKEPLLIQNK